MGARKSPMMAGFQAEENLTGRAPKKMCEKFWTLSGNHKDADRNRERAAAGEGRLAALTRCPPKGKFIH